MNIVEDTRQQKNQHELKNAYWAKTGHNVVRSALPFGDYVKCPSIAVDTKRDMQEIAQNIGQSKDHERFRHELVKARNMGCFLVILIENNDGITCVDDVKRWWNPRLEISPAAITGERLSKAMTTMEQKYGCKFMFCTPEQAGQKIVQLLEKE